MRGQLGLVSGFGLIPGIIRVATGGSISHIIIDVGNNQAISPQLGGCALRPLCDFPNIRWSQYPLTSAEEEAIVDFARAREGSPYNLMEAIALATSRFATIKYPTRQYAYYHCAQLANDAYLAAGINPLPYRRYPGPASPAHFETQFKLNGWWTPDTRRAVPEP